MVQKVNIVLVDDIDGSPADETVTFGLDGTTYEIDLSGAHAAQLRDAFGVYVGHARKVTSSGPRRRAAKASDSGTSAREIRDWARSNGHTVPERGRIPADVRAAFEAR